MKQTWSELWTRFGIKSCMVISQFVRGQLNGAIFTFIKALTPSSSLTAWHLSDCIFATGSVSALLVMFELDDASDGSRLSWLFEEKTETESAMF